LDALEKLPVNHLDNLERKEVGRIGNMQGVKNAQATVATVPKAEVMLELDVLVSLHPGIELDTYRQQVIDPGPHKCLLVLDKDAMRHLGIQDDGKGSEIMSIGPVFQTFARAVVDSLVAFGVDPAEPPMPEGLEQPSTLSTSSVHSTGSVRSGKGNQGQKGPKSIRVAAGEKVDGVKAGGMSVFS
jgi:hypothetical protein